jgi:hypothetical protein
MRSNSFSVRCECYYFYLCNKEDVYMSEKEFLDKVNPDRREFLEKVTKGAFIIPAVISVMMLNQKLNLTTANAASNMSVVF